MIGVSASVACVVLAAATAANLCAWDNILSGSKDLIQALREYDADRLGGPLTGSHCPGFTYSQLREFESALEALRDVEIYWIRKGLGPWRIDERSPAELIRMHRLLDVASRISPEDTDLFDPLTDDPSSEIVSKKLVNAVGNGDFFDCYSVLRHLLILGSTATWKAIFQSHSDRIIDHVLALAFYGPVSTRLLVQSVLPDADDVFITKLILRALDGAFIQRLASIIVAFDPENIIRCCDALFKDEDVNAEKKRFQERFLFLALAARMSQRSSNDEQNHVLDALFLRYLDQGYCVLALTALARDLGSAQLEALVDKVSAKRKNLGLAPLNAYLIQAMSASRNALSPTPCFVKLDNHSWLRSTIKELVRSEETTAFDRIVGVVSIEAFSSILNRMIKKMFKMDTLERDAAKVIRAVADLGVHMSSLTLSKKLWELIDNVPDKDDRIIATLYEAVAKAYSRAEFDAEGNLPAFFHGYTACAIHTFSSYDALKFVSDEFWMASLTAISRMPTEHRNAPEPTTQKTLLEMLIDRWYEKYTSPEHHSLYFSHIQLLNLSLFRNEDAWNEFILRNFAALFEDDEMQVRLLLVGLTPKCQEEAIQRLVKIINPTFLSLYYSEQLDWIGENLYGMAKGADHLLEYLIRYLFDQARNLQSPDQLRIAGRIASLAAPTLDGKFEAEIFLELVQLQANLVLESDLALALPHEFYCGFSQQSLQFAFKSIILKDSEWRFEAIEIRDRMKPETLAECRQDFAHLDPPLWAQIFGPAILNGLRTEFLFDPRPVLSFWLPAGPRRNQCLAEVFLAARAQSRDLLFELMTDPDYVYLLRYLLDKPDDGILLHKDLLLDCLSFVLNHRFSLRSKLFFGSDLDRDRMKTKKVLWPLLMRLLELLPVLPDRLVSLFTTSSSLKIEVEKLKLLSELVYLSSQSSMNAFRRVLSIISELPTSALDRIVFRQNILTCILLHGPQDASYAFITPIIAKMSPGALGDAVLALANRAAQFAVDERSFYSLRDFADVNVPGDLRACLRFAAVCASDSELDRVQRLLLKQSSRRRKPSLVINIVPVLSKTNEPVIESSMVPSKKSRIV